MDLRLPRQPRSQSSNIRSLMPMASSIREVGQHFVHTHFRARVRQRGTSNVVVELCVGQLELALPQHVPSSE